MTYNEKLFEACKQCQLDEVEKLLSPKKFFNFNLPLKVDLNSYSNDGYTPLHLALNEGCKDIVGLLIKEAQM